MKKANVLYILSGGRVAAINKKDGSIMWEVKLKSYLTGRGIHITIGQLSYEDGKLYIGGSGVLLCLDAKNGALLWKNELKGWGYGFVAMANVGNEATAATAISAASSAAVIAATA